MLLHEINAVLIHLQQHIVVFKHYFLRDTNLIELIGFSNIMATLSIYDNVGMFWTGYLYNQCTCKLHCGKNNTVCSCEVFKCVCRG